MKFTSQLAHTVPKHASQECSLTGRSQKTPGTDSKLIRTSTILQGWKQPFFISGCVTLSSNHSSNLSKVARSTRTLFLQRSARSRQKRAATVPANGFTPNPPTSLCPASRRSHQNSRNLSRRHAMVKYKIILVGWDGHKLFINFKITQVFFDAKTFCLKVS